MKKLEDIPKKQVFTVPDGYFDKLPGIIQSRIAAETRTKEIRPVFSYTLKYALPLIALLAIGIFWFNRSNQPLDANTMLATVQTEDLIAYLNDSDITTEELLESVEFNTTDLDEVEDEVYELNVNDEDFKAIMDDLNNF